VPADCAGDGELGFARGGSAFDFEELPMLDGIGDGGASIAGTAGDAAEAVTRGRAVGIEGDSGVDSGFASVRGVAGTAGGEGRSASAPATSNAPAAATATLRRRGDARNSASEPAWSLVLDGTFAAEGSVIVVF
jgi:hypothetical protein